MTVRVERSFEFPVDQDRVWEFISDPGNRAEAISVVDSWEQDGEWTVWQIALPIPVIRRTAAVRTRDIERDEGERVKFEGRSRVMNVTGEHELTPIEGGTRLTNRFVVEGRLPGVERFFENNLDAELDNLKHALEREFELEA